MHIPEATSGDRSPVSKHRPCWTPVENVGGTAKRNYPSLSPLESWRPRARDKSWRHAPEAATDVPGFGRVLPNKADDFHANASRDGPIPLVLGWGGDCGVEAASGRFRDSLDDGVCSRVFAIGANCECKVFFVFFRKIKI